MAAAAPVSLLELGFARAVLRARSTSSGNRSTNPALPIAACYLRPLLGGSTHTCCFNSMFLVKLFRSSRRSTPAGIVAK